MVAHALGPAEPGDGLPDALFRHEGLMEDSIRQYRWEEWQAGADRADEEVDPAYCDCDNCGQPTSEGNIAICENCGGEFCPKCATEDEGGDWLCESCLR